MELTREDHGQRVAILRLDGRLMGDPEAPLLIATVRKAIEDGRPFILMDLAKVPWMTSGGIGILTRIHATLKREQGVLVLLSPSDRVRRVLTVTGLIALFDSYTDERDALASFAD